MVEPEGRTSGHSGSESNRVEAALGETVSVHDAKNPTGLAAALKPGPRCSGS